MRQLFDDVNRFLDEPLGIAPRLLLGLAFLCIVPTYLAPLYNMTMFAPQYQDGLRLDSGIYGSIFYTLTVFHGLHVLVGLVLLLSLLPTALRPARIVGRHVRIRLLALFWHFVDVVWVVMFLLVYVV